MAHPPEKQHLIIFQGAYLNWVSAAGVQAGLEESELSQMRLNLMQHARPADLLQRMSSFPRPAPSIANPFSFMRRSSMRQQPAAPLGALRLSMPAGRLLTAWSAGGLSMLLAPRALETNCRQRAGRARLYCINKSCASTARTASLHDTGWGLLAGDLQAHTRRSASRDRDPSPTRGQFSAGWVPRHSMMSISPQSADQLATHSTGQPSGILKRRSVSADTHNFRCMVPDAQGAASPAGASKPPMISRWRSLPRHGDAAPQEAKASDAARRLSRSDARSQSAPGAAEPSLSGLTRFESLDFDSIVPGSLTDEGQATATPAMGQATLEEGLDVSGPATPSRSTEACSGGNGHRSCASSEEQTGPGTDPTQPGACTDTVDGIGSSSAPSAPSLASVDTPSARQA